MDAVLEKASLVQEAKEFVRQAWVKSFQRHGSGGMAGGSAEEVSQRVADRPEERAEVSKGQYISIKALSLRGHGPHCGYCAATTETHMLMRVYQRFEGGPMLRKIILIAGTPWWSSS